MHSWCMSKLMPIRRLPQTSISAFGWYLVCTPFSNFTQIISISTICWLGIGFLVLFTFFPKWASINWFSLYWPQLLHPLGWYWTPFYTYPWYLPIWTNLLVLMPQFIPFPTFGWSFHSFGPFHITSPTFGWWLPFISCIYWTQNKHHISLWLIFALAHASIHPPHGQRPCFGFKMGIYLGILAHFGLIQPSIRPTTSIYDERSEEYIRGVDEYSFIQTHFVRLHSLILVYEWGRSPNE